MAAFLFSELLVKCKYVKETHIHTQTYNHFAFHMCSEKWFCFCFCFCFCYHQINPLNNQHLPTTKRIIKQQKGEG